MDNRFKKISKLLSAYSLGNFNQKVKISSRMDEIDAFISGVNMLGEELKDRTISRDYFNNIFNSVSDMVFVLNKQGRIEHMNRSVTNHLQYSLNFLKGKSINYFFSKSQYDWFEVLLKNIRRSGIAHQEGQLKTKNKNSIPVLVSAAFLIGENKLKILITAKDISFQKKTENMILKAMIETEEKERLRLAKDIHDSIGQQLSAIKFYIGTSADAVEDPRQKSILLKANAALVDVQADIRNICFDIMPKSLEIFGLVRAVEELCSKNDLLEQMDISVREFSGFPRLPIHQEFALFRIIQEFINNTLKHSKAKKLRIEFRYRKHFVLITLTDDGIGFDFAKMQNQGMGLNNVRSRIRPYNGEVEIKSQPGKGTQYKITIPK